MFENLGLTLIQLFKAIISRLIFLNVWFKWHHSQNDDSQRYMDASVRNELLVLLASYNRYFSKLPTNYVKFLF